MICKKCGAQIPDDAVECEFCGAKTAVNGSDTAAGEDNRFAADSVRNTEEKPEEIFDDNEKRRREQMRKMMENKKQQLSEIEKRRVEKRQKQKRNRIMLVGAICAAAVAAAGIGTYYVAENVGEKAVVDESPVPTALAAVTPPAFTPAPSPTVAPSPQIFTSPAPNGGSSSSGTQSTQSWTASGSSSSGNSSGRGSSSGSGSSGSSSGGSSSGRTSSSGSSSSGGSSSGSGSSGGGSSSQSVSPSGKSSNDISSQLATGGEVIYNSSTGKYLMTFTVGNTKYYANVSPGSTTEQIQNKPYTVTAQPTSQTYDGNTIYEITDLTNYEGDYILANSGTKLLTNSDINGLSKYDLALARNEIYARHGRKFQTAEYNTYFSGKSWYKINPNYNYSDDNSNLNETERKNVQFILDAERK